MNRYKLIIKGKCYNRFIKRCIKHLLKQFSMISNDIISEYILDCERLIKYKIRKERFKEKIGNEI